MDSVTQGNLTQVAHVVRDLDLAMERYWSLLGIGPWKVLPTFAPPHLRESTYRGKPSDHTYLVAVAWINDVQYELIQPVSGWSIYDEHLEKRGEGLHHVKFYHPDCVAALEHFRKKGIEVIQSGKVGNDEFYYLDTESTVGVTIEIGNNGGAGPAERYYPESSDA
jgi:hypothetical protein